MEQNCLPNVVGTSVVLEHYNTPRIFLLPICDMFFVIYMCDKKILFAMLTHNQLMKAWNWNAFKYSICNVIYYGDSKCTIFIYTQFCVHMLLVYFLNIINDYLRNWLNRQHPDRVHLLLFFDDNKIKMARKPGKKQKENSVGCTGEGKRRKGNAG